MISLVFSRLQMPDGLFGFGKLPANLDWVVFVYSRLVSSELQVNFNVE